MSYNNKNVQDKSEGDVALGWGVVKQAGVDMSVGGGQF